MPFKEQLLNLNFCISENLSTVIDCCMSMPVQADSELGYILSAAGRPAIDLSTREHVSQSFKQT
jgi:hypothetical protein